MVRRGSAMARHVRWNWEEGETSVSENLCVRYHVVVVNDRDREGILRRVIDQLQEVSPGIEEFRRVQGKVVKTDYRYLFVSFESVVAPSKIDWTKVGGTIIRDRELRERRRGTIEDYVVREYER